MKRSNTLAASLKDHTEWESGLQGRLVKSLPLQLQARTVAVLARFIYDKPNFPTFPFSSAVMLVSLPLAAQVKTPHFRSMAALKGLMLYSTMSCTSFFYFSRAAPPRCRCHDTYGTTYILSVLPWADRVWFPAVWQQSHCSTVLGTKILLTLSTLFYKQYVAILPIKCVGKQRVWIRCTQQLPQHDCAAQRGCKHLSKTELS